MGRISGGVSPDVWMPEVPLETFEAVVRDWLGQKGETFRFIAAAGDQVPPGADERRIGVMRELVEEHGRQAAGSGQRAAGSGR